MPTIAAAPGFTSPRSAYETTPTVGDDPDRGERGRRRAASPRSARTGSSSGTITIPPPTPKSALKNPAARPIRTRRSTRLSFQPWMRRSSLRRLAAEPRRAAILLDVDGVLAPIVERPEDASRAGGDAARARAARGEYALVAASRARRATTRARVVGVDGLDDRRRARPRARAGGRGVGRRGSTRFLDSVAWPAERKRLTARFHYRTHPTAAAGAEASSARSRSSRASQGFRPRWGRMVLEIRPPVDADKGTAVRLLLDADAGSMRALYAGDDTTDLDAFRGARRARARRPRRRRVGGGAAAARSRGRPRRPRHRSRSSSCCARSDARRRGGPRAAPRALRRAARARVGGRGLASASTRWRPTTRSARTT